MITIDSIETKGLETVIKLSRNGKSQIRTYDVLQAGKFLSSLGNMDISYKNKTTLSNATALRNAYDKKVKTLDVKVGPVEAKVKIKTPENNTTIKIDAVGSSLSNNNIGKNTNDNSDMSGTLKKLRIYVNKKTQAALKSEQKRLEEYRLKLADDVKKLAHVSGVSYEYNRSKNKSTGNITEGVAVKKTPDFTKFSVSELKKMKKRLSLKIESQDKASKFKAEEQTKRRYKLIESRYKTLIENEEKLNELLNEREAQVIDIIDAFSELSQDSGYFINTGAKTESGTVKQSDLFNQGSATLKTGKELIDTIGKIRTLFKKHNSLNEEGIDPMLVDIKLVEKMDGYTKASREYTNKALGSYRNQFRNIDEKNRRLVEKYKRDNPQKISDIRAVLNSYDMPYEQLNEKNKKEIERQANKVIRNILKNKGLLFDYDNPRKIPEKIESVEIRKINARKETQAALEQAGKDLKKVIKQKVAEYMANLPKEQSKKLTSVDFQKISKEVSMKSLTAKFKSKTEVSPIGTSSIKGLDNIFSPEESLSVVIYNKDNPTRTKFVNYSDKFEPPEGWAIKQKSNGQPLIIREKTQSEKIFRKIRLKKASIPQELIREGIVDNYYGCVIAASFFQILVSNTPLDEEYDYETEEKETRTRNKRLRGRELDSTGKQTSYIKDEWDFQQDVEVFTYKRKRKRHHTPDKESVRFSWNLHYKGRTFTSKEINEKCMNCFAKKADPASIEAIAQYIHSKTKDSPLANINFTYDNSNKRWEQLEYGGYRGKNSGPYTGAKYGSLYQHGVTNSFSWQAPKGYVRVAEALWNSLAESDFIWGSVALFLNNALAQLDVSKVNSEIMQRLMKYDPDIGSSEYDYKEIYIGRSNQ